MKELENYCKSRYDRIRELLQVKMRWEQLKNIVRQNSDKVIEPTNKSNYKDIDSKPLSVVKFVTYS